MKNFFYPLMYAIAMASTIFYNGLNSSLAKYISMALFGVLFILAISQKHKSKWRPQLFRNWLLWLVLACFVNFVCVLKMGLDMKDNLDFIFNLEIAMPLITAFSSFYLLDLKREILPIYMLPICVFAAYCAISSVLSGLGGFFVSEYYDDSIAKNQIGMAFTLFAIICMVFTMNDNRLGVKIAYGVLSIICVYPALYFACRTALLSYFIVIVLLLYRDYRWKCLIILPLIVLAVVLVGGKDLRYLLYDSLVGNRDVNDVDALTSGRLTHARASIHYFVRHPLFGFYGSGDGYDAMPPNAHIFLLFRLTKWGIIGAIPFIALYWSIFKLLIRSIRKQDLMLFGVLLLALIESFSEYSPPFGPGSSLIVMYVLIGYYLRQETKSL